MNWKKILEELNIPARCRKYGISLWQCPDFIFLIMGIIIIFLILLSYAVSSRFIEEPEVVSLIVLVLALLLLIIAFIVNHSFERLAEANRMKSEFIHIVSHQLRTPLSNLRWTLELLMSGRVAKVEEEQLEYLKILKDNSRRMEEMVKDLLIVSRIETEKLSSKKEKFSLEELTREVIKEFEPFARASNVQINFSFAENLPSVFANRYQIKQVIENLLENAIRYTVGKGLVKIKIEKRPKEVFFQIEDEGIGIPKEDQKFIFQKFFRASNVLQHQTQGTGLGLYIAKSIIEKHRGKIGFFSQEGKGSKFWFTLPIK